jgi:hypothetical protein
LEKTNLWIHLLFGQKGKNVSDETRALIRKIMNEECVTSERSKKHAKIFAQVMSRMLWGNQLS